MKKVDESLFVRDMMFNADVPKWKRYAGFVLHEPSIPALIGYELRNAMFGGLGGALGYALRRRFFRPLLRKVGTNVLFGRGVVIRHGGNIELGDNVVIDDDCVLDGRGAADDPVIIGDNVIIGRGATIQSKLAGVRIAANCNIGAGSTIVSQGDPVVIDEWCQVAGGCKIIGGRFEVAADNAGGMPLTRSSAGPIRIGRGSFLGMGAIVVDGVSIGSSCAIGPGAVVMSSLKDHSVFMQRPGMLVGSTRPSAPAPHGTADA